MTLRAFSSTADAPHIYEFVLSSEATEQPALVDVSRQLEQLSTLIAIAIAVELGDDYLDVLIDDARRTRYWQSITAYTRDNVRVASMSMNSPLHVYLEFLFTTGMTAMVMSRIIAMFTKYQEAKTTKAKTDYERDLYKLRREAVKIVRRDFDTISHNIKSGNADMDEVRRGKLEDEAARGLMGLLKIIAAGDGTQVPPDAS